MADWVAWHAPYDDPSSSLSARLRQVRLRLSEAVSAAPPGRIRLLSLCAGQGRDVLGVLPGHPRRDDVTAVLVESDPANARMASEQAATAGLPRVEVRVADASREASLAGALPANVLLLCGIFGNISEPDIRRTVAAAPALCAAGAIVIWTRHRRPPDLTPQIRSWFAGHGFAEAAFDALDTPALASVGVHRLRAAPAGPLPSGPLFTFRPAPG